MSLIVIVLDNTILNVALPTWRIKSEGGLGAPVSELRIVDSYVTVFADSFRTPEAWATASAATRRWSVGSGGIPGVRARQFRERLIATAR